MREVALGRLGLVTAVVEASRHWLASTTTSTPGGPRSSVSAWAAALPCFTPQPRRPACVFYGAVPRCQALLAGVCSVVTSYGGRDLALRGHARRLECHLTALRVPHDVK